MNKRPGHVDVTTEVGYCSFCNRSRNLRREEHHLGTLVRTIVTCETCHRTLSSTMGVTEAAEPEPAAATIDSEPAASAADVEGEKAARPKRAPARRAAAARKAPAPTTAKAKAPARQSRTKKT